MRTGRRIAAGGGPGWAPGAGLTARDSRRVGCPRCGVKPVARCLKLDGTYAKNTHDERRAAFKEAKS